MIKSIQNKSNNITLQSENSLSIYRDIESDQNFGISKFSLDLKEIGKWRFQSDKLKYLRKK